MTDERLKDASRLAIHTMTNKPWSLAQCVAGYAAAGVRAISVWRNVFESVSLADAARMLGDAGLAVPALVRGGFFPAGDAGERDKAIDDNKLCIDQARAIGAEMIVLVVGAVPGMMLAEARRQVEDGIAAVLPHAEASGVKLAIEPLHPMYAADRSCINRMADARVICERLGHPLVGIALDVYHVWWDPDLEAEIDLAGRQGTLLGFHVCDWRVETRDLLTDRGMMGEGCIDIRTIRRWVERTGFTGFHEVEIFSEHYWRQDQAVYVEQISQAYLEYC